MKSRRHMYLDSKLMDELDRLAAKPGTSQSAIVGDALRAYFESRGADALDERLRVRLDRFGAQLGRIERDVSIVMESLALFVHYELMVTAPLPKADQAAARALAQDRFQEFLDTVSRRLANGKNFRAELLARGSQAETVHEH